MIVAAWSPLKAAVKSASLASGGLSASVNPKRDAELLHWERKYPSFYLPACLAVLAVLDSPVDAALQSRGGSSFSRQIPGGSRKAERRRDAGAPFVLPFSFS